MKTNIEILEFTIDLIKKEYNNTLTNKQLLDIIIGDFNLKCTLEDIENLQQNQLSEIIEDYQLARKEYFNEEFEYQQDY